MIDRDEKILRHIGLYRLTFRAVIARLFFAGKSPANVLQRLRTDGRIQSRQGISGRLSYYQLTPHEASARFHSTKRARGLRGQSLNVNLGILWFCCMAGQKRSRLEKSQLAKLFGEAPRGPHGIQKSGENYCVYRLFVASARTNDANLLARVRACLEQASQQPTLGAWVKNHQYGFAILVETQERVETIQRAIRQRAELRHARIIVEPTPGPRNIKKALHEQ